MSRPQDTEARYQWYRHGEDLEKIFVNEVAPEIGLPVILNPEKEVDPTVIDLLYLDGFPADLKTQNTPFFTAKRYGVPPQFAVTFNHKDYLRYKDLYPFAIIFFWVKWTQLEWKDKKVKPMEGIWKVPFWRLVKEIEAGAIPLHEYEKRKTDGRRNAKDSYIFDIRKFTEIWREQE